MTLGSITWRELAMSSKNVKLKKMCFMEEGTKKGEDPSICLVRNLKGA